jgi:hypothetical protein
VQLSWPEPFSQLPFHFSLIKLKESCPALQKAIAKQLFTTQKSAQEGRSGEMNTVT